MNKLKSTPARVAGAVLCLLSAVPAWGAASGDADGSGAVDIDDVNLVVNIMLNRTPADTHPDADTDGNGTVDIEDLNTIINVMLGRDVPPKVDYEAVDLGLPSGTRWAPCNLGADPDAPYETEEAFGDRYAWGETATRMTNYYVWENDFTYNNYQYYGNPIQRNDISGTEYDAARAQWGGTWRMPTAAELQELIELCTFDINVDQETYATCYTITGPNGNSIVMPLYYFWHQEEWEDTGYDDWEIELWTSTHYSGWESSNQVYSALIGWKSGENISVLNSGTKSYEGKFIRPVCSGDDTFNQRK